MAHEDFYEGFFTQDYEAVSDGMGGLKKDYFDRDPFRAAIHTVSTTQAELAYRSGTKTIYRITHPIALELHAGDVVRRVKDGKLYRITSDSSDNRTPDVAQERYAYVTAEVLG